jgi:hypothetical protein
MKARDTGTVHVCFDRDLVSWSRKKEYATYGLLPKTEKRSQAEIIRDALRRYVADTKRLRKPPDRGTGELP